jgi:hypothetical protein
MKRKTHDLHFIMTDKLYFQLSNMAHEMNKSLSSTIFMMIENFMPFIEKNNISFQDKESCYQLVGIPGEERVDVHAYIPEEYYRRLKQLHHDLNVYSLGQIIRKIIEYFLKACVKYGADGLLKKLRGIMEKWNKKKEILKDEGKEFKLLSHKNLLFPYLTISYDINSKPFIFKFI